MSPLHIDAAVNHNNTRLVQRTLQLAHRIQDIHIRSALQDVYLLELLTQSNPAVESIIVVNRDYWHLILRHLLAVPLYVCF